MRLSIPSAVFALACSGAWAKAPVNGTGALYEPKKFIVQVEKVYKFPHFSLPTIDFQPSSLGNIVLYIHDE
jgi:hypothetical protein